jgi:hypothetical protein
MKIDAFITPVVESNEVGVARELGELKTGSSSVNLKRMMLQGLKLNQLPESSPLPPQEKPAEEQNKPLSRERIILNARGMKFEVLVRTLDNVPNGRLNTIKHVIEANAKNPPNSKTVDLELLDDVCDDYSKDLKEFYFNRNPVVFENILKFYQQPVLEKKTHINIQDACPLELEEEFHYWRIDWEEYLDECCSVKLDDLRDHLHDEMLATKKMVESVTKRVNFGDKFMPKTREMVWYIMEVPKSSILARVYMLFSTLIRALSILNTVLSSLPSLNAGLVDDLSNPFNIVECLFIVLFTFGEISQHLWLYTKNSKLIFNFISKELLFRFIFCPNHLKYWIQPFNVLELCNIIPFYLWLIFGWWPPMRNIKEFSRVFRIFGLFKVFRISYALSGLKKSYFFMKLPARSGSIFN